MFVLEALKAKHGDCLLLHWGTKAPMCADRQRPERLRGLPAAPMAALGERKVPKVKLDLTMVSHIDDDHINGLLGLAGEIEEDAAPAEIGLLWAQQPQDSPRRGASPDPARRPRRQRRLPSMGGKGR